ncbi:diguanylate cyclase [Pseudomonas sp. 5P_3.1_Bac2]|uniref:diguanylate cyclase n=1 Tax=Pseudomonas sp. 5P_3.1_Bac2 TaxID=2971617 RepID=UPI0021CAA64E|nr:diguanylate cyclase [Pseudomonas sp. 5P_3.1_Bac2]MCU1718877.1 diguanylate cyclase [Pseudomonas sp. 5P_3.1_Bac2]
MADGASELQAQLKLLSDAFAQRLHDDLPALGHLAEQLANSPGQPEQLRLLQALHEQLHRLAGAAGTFGFVRLGQQVHELERQTEHWQQYLSQAQPLLSDFIASVQNLAGQRFSQEQEVADYQSHIPAPQPHHADRLIYILEAQPALGDYIRLTLGNFGYRTAHFSTLQALDAAVSLERPDALILDLELPASQGSALDYASQLQQRLAQPLPLLVISNRSDFATQLQAVRAGAEGFFNKPLDIAQLENSLEGCFAQQHGEPYRVLIIDDDRELAKRYSLILRSAHMQVEMLHEPDNIFSCMHNFNPEVILLDVSMPGCTGPELAQIIRLNDDWLRVPIVYLSAETDITRQMNALIKAGDDFVTKPISDHALVAAVFSRAQRARQLSQALARDSLTGLLKHADIKEQVAIEQARALRSGKPASVAMLDIDFFKKVNDSYGHAAGDSVIRALANLLRQRLRRIDSLGRYGGEEFLLVLPDCTAEQARRILDEIRQRFADLQFVAGEQHFSVTLSVGIASTAEYPGPTDALLEQADRALYSAKNSGRNCVV